MEELVRLERLGLYITTCVDGGEDRARERDRERLRVREGKTTRLDAGAMTFRAARLLAMFNMVVSKAHTWHN